MVFGPHPRAYGPKVPKRLRRLAIQSALNARALDGDLALLEPVDLDAPKTSRLAELLTSIGVTDGNVLILTAGHKPKVHLSSRNLKSVRVLPWGEASAYDVLWADLVLVESTAFEKQTEGVLDETPTMDVAPAVSITAEAEDVSEEGMNSGEVDSDDDEQADE